RELMMIFNDMLASSLESHSDIPPPQEQASLFKKSGKLIRKNIPKWVKRAVFFRDRGRCILYYKDLSGTMNIDNVENYDHIVPLAKYGLNDVSNIQLLCKECNQIEKRAGQAETSNKYQSWYTYDAT
ncbi:MAG: HNH endonuclease, partial [Flavobacteriales bacterium]|nr:HNH endonuclease [Flavobacteriales bacterium]